MPVPYHPPLPALEIVGDILRVEPIAEIVEHEPYHPLQQFHVADAMPLYRIAQDDGWIDVIYQLIDRFVTVITRVDSRKTARTKVFLKLFSQYVLAIRIYAMKLILSVM